VARGKKGYVDPVTGLDPPAGPSYSELQNAIAELDRNIALHTELLRGAALQVYTPLVEQALERIRAKAAQRLLPAAALPTRLEGFSIGQPVTVTMSPPTGGVIVGSRTNPETGKTELLLLVPGKGLVAADPSEVTPGLPAAPPPSTSTVSAPGPLPQGPEKPAVSSLSGSIHAGDLVKTPLGNGRVTAEPAAGGEVYQVDLGKELPYHFRRGELSLVPPPGGS